MKIFKAIKKGFTLVELVIVIAVIAVLSAVLIPVFGNVVKDSRVSALKASLKTCTSNLIMYSLYNQVDYYTPSVIREFLKSEGIKGLTSDDSEFCEDGYSIWYNQQNYNFYLVKNDELADFVGGGTSSASVNNRNTAAFAADIFGNVADGGVTQGSGENAGASAQLQRIPRRPEAITPDENLLLLATDEANKYILSGIETLYCGADTDKVISSAVDVLIKTQDAMRNGNLFNSFGDTWGIRNYTDKFPAATTAWLNNVGNFITDATFKSVDGKSIADISNVIVSPNIGSYQEEGNTGSEINGNIRNFGQNATNIEGAVLKVGCVIEIASVNEIHLGDQFYRKFGSNSVSVVISGNVSVTTTGSVSSVASGTTSVSTVTGGGSNISSVVNAGGGSAVVGGGNKIITLPSISASEFLEWTKNDPATGKPIVTCTTSIKANDDTDNNVVSVKLPDGKVITQAAGDSFFNTEFVNDGKVNQAVQYKYNISTFAIDVAAFLHKVNITKDEQVRSVTITSDAINNVYSTSVYLEYEIDNVMYGRLFNFGVGHITSFDHFYRYSNGGYFLGAGDYKDLKSENKLADAGSLLVKLPEGALELQSYKSGYTVEVVYDEVTRFYEEKQSEFGAKFYQPLKDVVIRENTKSAKFTAENLKGSPIEFGSFNRSDEQVQYATHFINTVKIKRILIKDKDGKNILIAKYPQAEGVQYAQ